MTSPQHNKLVMFYSQLLAFPDDEWRAKHQELYAFIRDQIAKDTGMTSQVIQENAELSFKIMNGPHNR